MNTEREGPSQSSTAQETPSLNRVSDQKWKLHLKKKLDPIAGSPATGNSVAGTINLFVDHLFGTGGNEMEQRFLTRLRTYFKLVQKIGMMWPSQDKEFAGHKIPKPGRTLKLVKKRPLRSWRRSQWNDTRRKTSSALLQCIQCTVFLAESCERSSRDGMTYGSLIDNESQKVKNTVLSTTVAEL